MIESSNQKLAPCIAVLGTGSDVGKSIIVTALCRHFAYKGYKVAPYKAQNMSNNSGVTPEGLEMGRAQIVQAEAAGIVPQVDMNPVLLKPTSEIGSQVVLLGQAVANTTAMDYHHKKEKLYATACDALVRLRRRHDLVILEGAGSCAEVNLMEHDIVNFRMAAEADAPVILVGDIHRGGIFAQLVGTLACLPRDLAGRVAGFIINRFRGDINLFADGVRWIEGRTSKPVFGVLPWYNHIEIQSEDSVVIENPPALATRQIQPPAVAILRIPHIANFTDMDALENIDGLNLHYLEKPRSLAPFQAVIIPGSKNTRFDLAWLWDMGWGEILKRFADKGGHILGICGGYQMMGSKVEDPHGLEGRPGETPGLGLLPVKTVLRSPKTTTLTEFDWEKRSGKGYEIHMGRTHRENGRALFRISSRNGEVVNDDDGCLTPDGCAMGTYIHGLFDSPQILKLWLAKIGLGKLADNVSDEGALAYKEKQYHLLSDHFERHINMRLIDNLAKGKS
jgi:adenosylcobyric acid synthase